MSAQDKFHYYIGQIDKELAKYPILNKLEKHSQVPKAYSVLGLVALFVVLIFFNVFAGFLTNVLGWAVPAYFSLVAIDTPGNSDDVQWLTYWVIFGSFTFIESFAGIIVHWFPFYYSLKVIFILWLILPSTRGAEKLYSVVFKPLTGHIKSHTTKAPAPVASTLNAAGVN